MHLPDAGWAGNSHASEIHMMLKSQGERGRGINSLIVVACMWPRSRYHKGGPIHAHNHHSLDMARDRKEILAYIAQNGPCSRWDIELCCHQSKDAVLGHLAALQKAGDVDRYHDSYQVVV